MCEYRERYLALHTDVGLSRDERGRLCCCGRDGTLTAGSIQIRVKGSSITELDCECAGGLDALTETAPVTVSVKMDFAHNSGSEVPSAVKNQLIQERTEENGQ